MSLALINSVLQSTIGQNAINGNPAFQAALIQDVAALTPRAGERLGLTAFYNDIGLGASAPWLATATQGIQDAHDLIRQLSGGGNAPGGGALVATPAFQNAFVFVPGSSQTATLSLGAPGLVPGAFQPSAPGIDPYVVWANLNGFTRPGTTNILSNAVIDWGIANGLNPYDAYAVIDQALGLDPFATNPFHVFALSQGFRGGYPQYAASFGFDPYTATAVALGFANFDQMRALWSVGTLADITPYAQIAAAQGVPSIEALGAMGGVNPYDIYLLTDAAFGIDSAAWNPFEAYARAFGFDSFEAMAADAGLSLYDAVGRVYGYRDYAAFARDTGFQGIYREGLPRAERIEGTGFSDVATGGGGNDRIDGAKGSDLVAGGEGADTLIGGAGRDLLEGGADDDVLSGGRGLDRIDAGPGDDAISGGRGKDRIVAGAGDDTVSGGGGKDAIVGGPGFDDLTGGRGADRFVFVPGDALAVIHDFGGRDRIDLRAFDGIDGLRDLVLTPLGEGTVVDFGDSGESAYLVTVPVEEVSRDAFLF